MCNSCYNEDEVKEVANKIVDDFLAKIDIILNET